MASGDTQQETQTQTHTGAYSQPEIDSAFGAIAQRQPEVVREAFRAYWDLAEETLRTARRVSEQQALSMAKQELVQEVSAIVLSTLQKNPQLILGRMTQDSPPLPQQR